MLYRSIGRRKVEEEIFEKLESEHCDPRLLENPRIIDIVNQIQKMAINNYFPQMPDIGDIEYIKVILPEIQMFINNNNHFWITEDGDIRIALPLLEEDFNGGQEKQKDILYNRLKEGMEKVCILDYRRYGIERLFRSIRYVYDQNGIETEREIEMLERNEEGSKTTYTFKERLKDNPHIIKVIQSSKRSKQSGKVSFYDIRYSEHIEDLDETEGIKIEEKDIRDLTQKEKKEVIIRQLNPMYQEGISSLMKIEREERCM